MTPQAGLVKRAARNRIGSPLGTLVGNKCQPGFVGAVVTATEVLRRDLPLAAAKVRLIKLPNAVCPATPIKVFCTNPLLSIADLSVILLKRNFGVSQQH